MSSGLDVYAPCPCGSGKKVKFCCNNALVELDRVVRLHEKYQPQQAFDALTKIGKQFPDAPIIPITRAQLLMEQERFDEAATEMREFVKVHNDIGHGHALLAMAHMMDVGFHEAKPEIHRAFQVSHQTSAEVLSSLAIHIANSLVERNSMAAREHLALALRLARDPNDRKDLFQELMKLDSSPQLPYPLRSTHHLEKVEAPEGFEKAVKNAYRMSLLGCWEIAGKLFLQVTEKLPEHWGLWKNIGLCRIWDDDVGAATEALAKAAEFAPNFEDAVECETISQLLQMQEIEPQTPLKLARFKVQSTSRALTQLDALPRCWRQPDTQNDPSTRVNVVGRYLFMDSTPTESNSTDKLEFLPLIQSEIVVYEVNAGAEEPFRIVAVSGYEQFGFASALNFVQQTLEDNVIPFSSEEAGHQHDHDHGPDCDHDHDHDSNEPVLVQLGEMQGVATELLPLQERRHLLNRTPDQLRQMRTGIARKFLDTYWYQLPLNRLGGKSPEEAAKDPSLKIKVCAAIYALDAIAHLASNGISPNEVRRHLGIEPEAPCTANDETIDSLSVMQSHRLPVEELSAEQLSHVLQRSTLIRYVPFTFTVTQEIAKRGVEHLKGLTPAQFAKLHSDVAEELGHQAIALEWCEKARLEADRDGNFQLRLEATFKEFQLRLVDKSDPKLLPLIDRLWNYFGTKLPEIQRALAPLLLTHGLPIPGQTASGLVLPDSMTVGASGTAEAPKLWLPEN